MSASVSDAVVRLEIASRAKAGYDLLVVGDDDLIDLEAEDSVEFPFPGGEKELAEEIHQIQTLLMASPPEPPLAAAPARKPCKAKGPKRQGPTLACLGHSPERVKQIDEDNARMVRRLQGVASAPSAMLRSTEEHDRVGDTDRCRGMRQNTICMLLWVVGF